MLNNRLFWLLLSLCLTLPTMQALAQESVETDLIKNPSVATQKGSVKAQKAELEDELLYPHVASFDKDTRPEFRSAMNGFYGAVAELESLQSELADEEGLSLDKALRKTIKKEWARIAKFIDSKKPVVIAQILYGSQASGYYGSENNVNLLFADGNQADLLKLQFSFSDHKPDCDIWKCSRSGMHWTQMTDYFAWDKAAQKVLWVGSTFDGYKGDVDEEEKQKLSVKSEFIEGIFGKTLRHLYDLDAVK